MGQTRYYNLTFFDFGDNLTTELNVQKEIDRFVIIDKQLYGLYNIFGNGVISGWEVFDDGFTETDGISILISPGMGVIQYIALETSLPAVLQGLTPNNIIDIYATLTGSTVRDRTVSFITSEGGLTNTLALKIATVYTGDNNITAIDNTVKDWISFESFIQDEINTHKHRGTPTKIDLQTETKNQLPGARISSMDASKITSGIFDIERIPVTDHDQLNDNGLLTHAALDTFVRTLSQSNKELLGEIASVDLLKLAIFLKYKYGYVDEHFINALFLIPGISPNSFIDFTYSTAHIDLNDQCISGLPAQTGLFTSVYWDDQFALYNAYYKNNVIVSDGKVFLNNTGVAIEIIENFDHNITPGEEIPGFVKEISETETNVTLISDNTDSDKVQGLYSGKFGASSESRVSYTKTFNSPGNWTDKYNEFIIWAKTTTAVHKTVYFYLINSVDNVEEQIGPFILIDEDHITENNDITKNNFEEIIIDISNKNVNNITKMVIFTDDTNSDFTFFLDNIYVRKEDIVSPSGTIRFRYASEAEIVFHSLFYEALIYDNTNIEVRIKTASNIDLLPRSVYSPPLSSGDVFSLNGSVAEIEVTLTSTDQISTPILDSVALRLLVDADFTGFTIDTATEWNRGTLENIETEGSTGDKSDLILESPVNVDGYYFGHNDAISELDSENIGIYGFSGNHMPIAPNDGAVWNNNKYHKFKSLSSVIREFDKNFIIADTINNRIVEVDNEGHLIKGFGSTYIEDTTFYPISAVYNDNSKILFIVFSKGAVVNDITKIALYIETFKISLTNKDIVLNNQKAGNKILEIQLDDDTSVQLLNVTNNLTVNFDNGSFTEDIQLNTNMNKLIGLYGMECFVGDFTYIDGIRHPIFADIINDNSWIVANSSIFYVPLGSTIENLTNETISVPDILEFNPTTQITIFSSNFVKFSDFTLGSIYILDDNRFIVAGLEEGATITGGLTGNELLGSVQTVTDSVLFRAQALDALNEYRGVVVIIDKINNKFEVFYNNPDGLYSSDVDRYLDGSLLTAESTFANSNGRLTKLDSFGNVSWIFGEGTFTKINDSRIVNNNHIMVSL